MGCCFFIVVLLVLPQLDALDFCMATSPRLQNKFFLFSIRVLFKGTLSISKLGLSCGDNSSLTCPTPFRISCLKLLWGRPFKAACMAGHRVFLTGCFILKITHKLDFPEIAYI